MSTFQRGLKILRTRGLLGFLKATIRFIYWDLRVRNAYLRFRHKLSGQTTRVNVRNISVTLSTTTYAEFERFYDLKGERETLSDVLSEMSSDDVFFDIGANVGLYSCFVGSAVSGAQVYSFEPHPTNIDALKKNLEMNSINSTIFQLALSDEEGTFELASEGSEAGLGEHSLNTEGSSTTVTVTVRQLDDLRDEYEIPVPTMVKIDVEGAELDVIKGATETFSDPNCKIIYCEVHPGRIETFGGTYDKLKNELADLGFEIETADQEIGGRIMVKAKK